MAAISRRRFLGLTAAVGGGAVLAACGGAAPVPTATPVPVAKPFATVAPTSAPAAAGGAASGSTASSAGATAAEPLITAKPPQRPEPITLRFHFRAGGDKSEPAIYVERPGEWSQVTGHKIALEPIPSGKEYPPKIVALATAGNLGDLMFTSVSEANHFFFVQNKLIEPVDDYMPKYNIKKEEWVSAIIKTLTIGGKMYGMPKASNPAEAHFAVNLKLFEEAGLKKPEIYGNSFDDLRNWAIKLTKGPPDRRDVYGIYSHTYANQAVTNGVRARGADLIDAAGEKSLVDSPQFNDWLQWNYKLYREDKVHPMPDVLKPGDSNALAGMFAAGKIAISQIHRSWMVAFKTAVGDKFPWMFVQHPKLPNAKGWVANIDTHSATTQSKYKDEAFTLTYALADRRFAYVVAKGQGYLTGRVDNLEAIGPELAKDPFLQIQQKCTEEEEPWWIAKNLRQLEVEAELLNQLDTVWLGKRPPDKAFIGDLKKALDDVLAKPPL
jgi:ABC-type glycerol-3-phosphate transport system substrate-binding protein